MPDAPGMASETVSSSSNTSSSNQDVAQSNANQPAAPLAPQKQQTKRILGIIPNFRAVNANTHLPPQSVKDKFVTATQDSFDYSSVILPAALAGYSMATNATPEFHQGAAGYGRYFWHTYVDQTIENYAVEFIVPAIAHEDTRYYTMGSGGFLKRTKYSLSRVVVTRSDDGRRTFNAGEIIGAGAAAGISNLYYPQSERTFGNTAQKWGLNVGVDAATFMFKEFWPDINHALFHSQN
ncbi:MAG: hypothetical protein JWQ42_1440 [Edaphobacter sp.]|nr:hypothetical protein [Edaphobacter sp.]